MWKKNIRSDKKKSISSLLLRQPRLYRYRLWFQTRVKRMTGIESKLLHKLADLNACEGEISQNQKHQRSITYKNDLLQKRTRVLRGEIQELREALQSQYSDDAT